ncbi:MAG: alanine racemase [Synechococcales bacterium]|nr:alanine racemase [Synechococcales bacterium]
MLSWDSSSSIARMQRERAWVEVDEGAIAHNVQQIRRILQPKTDLMTVVKADAYGHGSVNVARTALQAGATWLGVATIPEGIELREAGIEAPILILGATHLPEQIRTLLRWRLQPTLCTPKQTMVFAETMAECKSDADWAVGDWAVGDRAGGEWERDRPILPVHLKLDTGMTRLGTSWEQGEDFIKLVQRLPNLALASIYSHFATADELDQTTLRSQQQRFESVLRSVGLLTPQARQTRGPKLHFANSAATLTDRNLHYDLVRTGLITYGIYPAEHLRHCLSLQPAMQVKARVTQVKTIAAGTGVSYGHRFVSDREMQVAVIGIGYADGVPRNLSNQMEVLIRGQRVRQIGAITMDQIMLDVSAIDHLQEGEVVTVLGKSGDQQITADDWAQQLGTISWEILCGFKHRLPRVMVRRSLVKEPISSQMQ